MRRREFIRLSSLSILPLLVSCNRDRGQEYDIRISSDMQAGHLIFSNQDFANARSVHYDTLIVGGGISGLAAACSLGENDFILCELSEEAGGTSGSIPVAGRRYAQGAHYDLAYPGYFGAETLAFLEKLQITEFNSFTGLWEFKEKKYVIDPSNESRCLSNGLYREDVIPDDPARENFRSLLEPYRKEMKLPTRLIDGAFRHLDSISFSDFLNRNISLNEEFRRSIDYNMLDDYGGPSAEVSALAGIHYYQCRPYFYQPVELFSPPQGNYYFVKKMLDRLPPDRIKTGHLVRRIQESEKGFMVEVIDLAHHDPVLIKVNRIIYAGSKHALKYIFPREQSLFSGITYAPWIVMNFIMKNTGTENARWQNEILNRNPNLLGFVDSAAQFHEKDDPHILTVYYCFRPSQRQVLAKIEENKDRIVNQTVRYLSEYFKSGIAGEIEKVFIKVLGHAMPVPRTHYLFNDRNPRRSYQNLVYAGVDNSRLPLLFEALDSGICAAALLKETR